jgi:hypothetical protein
MTAELAFAIHQRLFLDEMEETTLFWAVLRVQSVRLSQRHIRVNFDPLYFSLYTPNNFFLIYPLLSIETWNHGEGTKDEAQGG